MKEDREIINGIEFVKVLAQDVFSYFPEKFIWFLPENFEKMGYVGFWSIDDGVCFPNQKTFWLSGKSKVSEEEFWRAMKLKVFQ